MKRTENYIKESLTKAPDQSDKRIVLNVWFSMVNDQRPDLIDGAHEFFKMLGVGSIPMPQEILDQRDELLTDTKNW